MLYHDKLRINFVTHLLFVTRPHLESSKDIKTPLNILRLVKAVEFTSSERELQNARCYRSWIHSSSCPRYLLFCFIVLLWSYRSKTNSYDSLLFILESNSRLAT